MMGLAPPAAHILITPDPWLAVSTIGDGRPHLRLAIGFALVEPVEAFAPRHIAHKVVEVVPARPQSCVGMRLSVAPVRQGHIVVDAHRIDMRRGPERIEVKELLATPWLVAAIFAPVRRIGQHGALTDHRPYFCGQRHQRRHEREAVASPPHRCQPTHFRADDQRIDAARFHRQVRIMQHHGAIRCGKRCHLPRTRRSPVRRARPSRRRMAGDAAPPGIMRLFATTIGIGQAVPRGHVHHHHGIKRYPQTARLEVGDSGQHGRVRRRPAIGSTAIVGRNNRHILPAQAHHTPLRALDVALPRLHPWPDRALSTPQVIAEPCDHQRHMLEVGAKIDQFVDGQRPVTPVRVEVGVLCHGMPWPNHPHAGHRVIAELGGAGDHRHGLDIALKITDDPAQFHRQVRNAVAEAVERQLLHHEVAHAPVSRRLPLRGLNQPVGQLVLCAPIKAQR